MSNDLPKYWPAGVGCPDTGGSLSVGIDVVTGRRSAADLSKSEVENLSRALIGMASSPISQWKWSGETLMTWRDETIREIALIIAPEFRSKNPTRAMAKWLEVETDKYLTAQKRQRSYAVGSSLRAEIAARVVPLVAKLVALQVQIYERGERTNPDPLIQHGQIENLMWGAKAPL